MPADQTLSTVSGENPEWEGCVSVKGSEPTIPVKQMNALK